MKILFLWVFAVSLPCVLSYKIIPIPIGRDILIGETPYWDAKTQSLYFGDLFNPNATICRYDYKCDRVYCANIPGESSAASIIPVKCCPNQFLIGLSHSSKIIYWDGISPLAVVMRVAFSVEPDASNLMNHAEVDPKGRVYTGTYGKELCGSVANSSLYSYSKKKGVQRILPNLKTTVGQTFNPDEKKFYHMDACAFQITEFDWDPKTGAICNGRVAFKFNVVGKSSFLPIGLTIDRKGYLYTGTFGGGKILKIDPRTSCVIKEINMPAPLICTPAFGGPKLNELFVTSGSLLTNFYEGGAADQQPTNPLGGSLFRIIGLGAKGWSGKRAAI